MTRLILLAGSAVSVLALVTPAVAQESEEGRSQRTTVQPYIEVSQIGVVTLSPDEDAVTYTQAAVGVDAQVNGRNTGGSLSIRYEYNKSYDDDTPDSDTVSGVARGYASIVPQVLTVDVGGLAARTRVDGNGGATLNPLNGEDSESRIYSAYAGPTLNTRAGDVAIAAQYRVGYTKVEQPDALVLTPGADPVDVFDDSISQRASVHVGTSPGEPLPIGVGLGAGWAQEDVSNLDQRVRDIYARADVTVPVSHSVALVGGIGYEDVVVSSRDALLDTNGQPVIGNDGRLVTDKSQPRQIAFEADGLIWDAGVVWRPSSRTAFEAHYGRRYDSDTYHGSFAWAPSSRSSLNVSVYDSVSGFGGQLNTALANLPTEFNVARNSLTGDLGGCVASVEGSQCLTGALGSVRSSVFRSRGVSASYTTAIGRMTAGIGAGYDRRKFLAPENTVLADANGVVDEAFYGSVFLSGDLGRRANFSTNAYATLLQSGFDQQGEVLATGASASYNRSLTDRLSLRAAVALDHIDSDLDLEDLTAASGLLGLRYGF
ncbi:preprotein translocase subunit YajC [Parerythrobacter lacustris]|uniref:Preprotein translocase subunit YajC n=1 Tax=Parerythrobacter lacustris TaxID=2969984 RepID=A0ABT1XPV1_9SPHN|nr:preprotein translocase subunit YajC [Parerythrobacter lacustris]MCR2833689.1 preprotein translocase subunit YajC [Parerythrobacter lacustris]